MAKQNQFRTEHVQDAPSGWRVKTLTTRTGHEVRLAFPPGRRKRGSGRLVSILHPHGENAESCDGPNRHTNPAELLILNPRKGRNSKFENRKSCNPKAVTFDQAEAKQKKAIDFLDRIDAEDPNGIRDMSVSEYAEHKGLKLTNPKSKSKVKTQKAKGKSKNPKRRRNQEGGSISEGKELYRAFHGKEPAGVRELEIKTEVPKNYVYFGDLLAATFLQEDGRLAAIKFRGDKIQLAGSPDGKQLYCIGGNQNMLPALEDLGYDTHKDLISIGRWHSVVYLAAKSSTNFELTEWTHDFGCVEEVSELLKRSEKEEWSNEDFQAAVKEAMDGTPPLDRDLPEAVYDRLNQRILWAGGSYYIAWPGIVG